LPTGVTFASGGFIQHGYTADGIKRRMMYKEADGSGNPVPTVFASSGNVQPYKYNGKEYDGKKGLNWYDYGARHYDAALGRFTTNDRFAEKYHSMSPYQYGANNRSSKIIK